MGPLGAALGFHFLRVLSPGGGAGLKRCSCTLLLQTPQVCTSRYLSLIANISFRSCGLLCQFLRKSLARRVKIWLIGSASLWSAACMAKVMATFLRALFAPITSMMADLRDPNKVSEISCISIPYIAIGMILQMMTNTC